MKRICVSLALVLTLSACTVQSVTSMAPASPPNLPVPVSSEPEPSASPTGRPPEPSAEPSVQSSPSPGASPDRSEPPDVSPGEDPMVDKTYNCAAFQVRSSWSEQTADGGAVLFELDKSCLLMFQQVAHDGGVSDQELLHSVMEALAPGGSFSEQTKDGFAGMSCQYERNSDGKTLQCVSYAYVHGKLLTTLSLLLEGEHADAAEATLKPILDTLKLTKA